MTKNVDMKIEFPNLISKLESFEVKKDRYESRLFIDDNFIFFKILDKNNPERYTFNGWQEKGTYKEFKFMYDPMWEGMMDHMELRKIWKPGDPKKKFPNPYPKLNAILIEIPVKFYEHSYREDNANLLISLNLGTDGNDYQLYNREQKNYKRFKFSNNKKKEAEDLFLREVNNWEENLEISKFNENEFKKKAEEDLKKYGKKEK